jgi:hypothetical protein
VRIKEVMGNSDEKETSPIAEAGKKFGWKEEEFEETNSVYIKTNYPAPDKKYRLIYESFTLSMEETYFWIFNQLKYDLSFPFIEKISDVFSASENSSFFGQASQRLSIQQDKVQTLLATTGKMGKDLFALVRELRIIDERMAAYEAWNKDKSKSADSTLKQIYIDFAESQGGQTKPSSVYGLAQNLQYVTLPDFFFNTRVYAQKDVDTIVDKIPTNNNLRNVLRRKLLEFIIWKEKTEKELINRRKFSLHYLRQHWAIIKMYMGWLKPYLRNVKRLTMSESQIMSPEIISAFETAALEIELIAYDKNSKVSPCILVTFKYYVKPSLSYQQPESYQRGPIHVGKVEMAMRSYGWTQEEVSAYKKYREKEEMELLGIIDASLKAAMDALSEDLDKYLAEAGEEEFKKKLEEKDKPKDPRNFLQKWLNAEVRDGSEPNMNVLEPFTAVLAGFGEIIGALVPISVSPKDKKADPGKSKKQAGIASKRMMLLLKNYKKSHQLLTW